MANSGKALWSYSAPAALGAAIALFAVGVLVLVMVRRASGWPSEAAIDWVVLILLIISLAPVGLKLLDFLAERRAVLGSKWFNLDLSRMDLMRVSTAETEAIPANLGITGAVVSDTAPMDIMEALRKASRQPFVVVDIGDGDDWWVTRLLAFSAGAIRRLAPEAIVFIGRRETARTSFWAGQRPRLCSRPYYRTERSIAHATRRQWFWRIIWHFSGGRNCCLRELACILTCCVTQVRPTTTRNSATPPWSRSSWTSLPGTGGLKASSRRDPIG